MDRLQQLWFDLYKGRDPIIVTTLLSFVLHESVYYLRFVPYLICDHIPALRKYKIQDTKKNTPELMWKCLKSLLLSQFFVQLPLQILFHPLAEFFGMQIIAPFPTIQKIAMQVLAFMVFEDFYHYWMHRLLHYGPFYKYIHKQHHEFTAPFGITAEYAHPLETIILGIGTIGGPLLYVYMTKDLHLVTVFTWIITRLFQTVSAHSGYDFPWSLRHFFPLWAGADFHDHHHMVFLGNYSSTFRHWDWLFGTDKRYNTWKARKASGEKSVDPVFESPEQAAVSLKEE